MSKAPKKPQKNPVVRKATEAKRRAQDADKKKGRRATPTTRQEEVTSAEPAWKLPQKKGLAGTGGYTAKKGMSRGFSKDYTASSVLQADGKFQGPTRTGKLSSPKKK